MEIGIDSFAATLGSNGSNMDSMAQLLEKIELADQAGLDVFGAEVDRAGRKQGYPVGEREIGTR